VTSEPRAFLTRDTGGATIASALIGRVGGRWRLIGSIALPVGVDPDALGALLVHRATTADPELAASLGLDRTPRSELPVVEVSSNVPPRLAVVAGSERAVGHLVAAASRCGWATVAASAESADPLEMTTLLLDPATGGILAGAGDPPAADERRALGELGALVAAAAQRRPELPVVLAGGMAEYQTLVDGVGDRVAPLVSGPAAHPGPDGIRLRDLLMDAALPQDEARRCLGAAASALAEVLDRRVDVVEVGFDAGTRAAAWPRTSDADAGVDLAIVPAASLSPADPDDQAVDRVATWTTWTGDRHRVRDRMRELRIAPWADATGEGVAVRMAAARAALSSLARWTPEWADRPAPDIVVATGGAWAAAPPPAIALAIADVLRRPGATQVAFDHARILSALGSIPDERERRAIVADLADDLLAPIGTMVMPGGLRHGRTVGVDLHLDDSPSPNGRGRRELRSGSVEIVELPPGASALVELHFQDTVRLGGRGRHFALEVTGGLGGLMFDLRDVPLRLPDRTDLRRELLETWQAAVGAGRGS
jgi:hypothetical protein